MPLSGKRLDFRRGEWFLGSFRSGYGYSAGPYGGAVSWLRTRCSWSTPSIRQMGLAVVSQHALSAVDPAVQPGHPAFDPSHRPIQPVHLAVEPVYLAVYVGAQPLLVFLRFAEAAGQVVAPAVLALPDQPGQRGANRQYRDHP